MSTLASTTSSRLQDLAVDDLRELMQIVTESTQALQSTHEALQHEVVHLKGELAEANRQLKRSRELAALGEMAAGIAHEIRNPLGSIQLYIQILADDLRDRPDDAVLCAKIENAVQSMDAIVGDVLAFARDVRIRPVATTAGDLLRRALAGAEALIIAQHVDVAWGDDGDCPIEADPSLMVQAIANLIRNGIEAMAEAAVEAPRLEVSAAIDTRRVPGGDRQSCHVISIRDHGPGLPEGQVDRMFNPFFTTRATGTGLGLAIVHRILDAHDGFVVATNDPAGGARIDLCLPPHQKSMQDEQLDHVEAAHAVARTVREELVEGESS
ncbi:MAG: ATP-binding protein [Planctomycetota bacterium]